MVMANLGCVLSRMVRGVDFQWGIRRHVRLRLGQLYLVVIHAVRLVL